MSRDEELLLHYLPVVKELTDKVGAGVPTSVQFDDLYSAGLDGLMSAVEHYDESQAESFVGYVRLRIRGAMQDFLRKQDHLPRYYRLRAKLLARAVEKLEQERREPTPEALAAELSISASTLRKWQWRTSIEPPLRLDAELPGSNDAAHTLQADESPSPLEVLLRDEMVGRLMREVGKLPDRNRRILMEHYFEGRPQKEIARRVKLTESRVSQILQELLPKLRRALERKQ